MFRPNDFKDLIANIFLFIPFGFGVTCLTQKLKIKTIKAWLLVFGSSFTLSFLVEFIQIFLPIRNPTYVDVLTNTLGGLVGFLVFKSLGILVINCLNFIVVKLHKSKLLTNLIIVFLMYFYLACLLSFNIQGMTKLWDLSNWDSTYPLSLGNEITDKRPWYGEIFEFCVADRSFSETEIGQILSTSKPCNLNNSWIAAYVLTERGDYKNLKKDTPNLVWQQKSIDRQWLKTETSATSINHKIRDRSKFTIVTTLASNNLNQTGPARIISLSQDPFHRNLTIGQWHNHLSLRLRTPLTKLNGTRPEFIIPNVFNDHQIHRLVISYHNQSLSVYSDKLSDQHSFKFSPEAALFWYLSPSFSSLIHLSLITSCFYQLIYCGFIFIPLGILAKNIISNYSINSLFYYLAITTLTIMPAFLLEAMLAIINEENINIRKAIFSSLLCISLLKINLFKRVVVKFKHLFQSSYLHIFNK